jgi:hypothetical protein
VKFRKEKKVIDNLKTDQEKKAFEKSLEEEGKTYLQKILTEFLKTGNECKDYSNLIEL